MAWIKTISYENAMGKLKVLYDRIKGPDNYLDNIMKVHSLRPPTLEGHMSLYKNLLHHSENRLPKWLKEAIGLYVSRLNSCDYCVRHHFRGMSRLLQDESRSAAILDAMEKSQPAEVFEGRELAIMNYAAKLTKSPETMAESDVSELREWGLDDGEILEINQVASYFAYANRTVLGLGVTTEGDILGLAPSENGWHHQ